jgi:hypothetical protein
MNKLKTLAALAAAALVALPALAQNARRATAQNFASDFQTVPVMANTSGINGATFQTFVAIQNPTAAAFAVQATLYDAAGVSTTRRSTSPPAS